MWLLAQQAFPPNQTPTAWTVAIHIGLLALVVTALVGTIWMNRSRPRLYQLLVWPSLVVLTIALIANYEGPDSTFAFVRGYVGFVVVISLANFLTTLVALVLKLERSSRGGLVSSCVIGLGVVILLLLPATPSVREAARRTDCKNRIKTLALAMHDWHDQYGRLPDLVITSGDPTSEQLSPPAEVVPETPAGTLRNAHPPRTWRVELLPYLDLRQLREQYQDNVSWASDLNLPVAQTRIDEFYCPSVGRVENRQDKKGRRYTHFLAVTGPDTVFAKGKGLNLDDVSQADGCSKTLLLIEASGRNIVWTEPRDADTSEQPVGLNLPGNTVFDSPGLGSTYHYAGVNMAFADGTVYTVPKTIDRDVLRALTTAHGNDPIDRGF